MPSRKTTTAAASAAPPEKPEELLDRSVKGPSPAPASRQWPATPRRVSRGSTACELMQNGTHLHICPSTAKLSRELLSTNSRDIHSDNNRGMHCSHSGVTAMLI